MSRKSVRSMHPDYDDDYLITIYLGSLCKLVRGLGLAHAQEEINDANVVKNIMSEKAI